MSFADDLATETKTDSRAHCMAGDWLKTLDAALADEIHYALTQPGANVSAILRVIKTPKYGYPGSLATLARHAKLACSCGAS